jgi:hypothetical protein
MARLFRQLLANSMSSGLIRSTMGAQLNRGTYGIDPPGRDLDLECGYPLVVTPQILRHLYRRNGIAARVVNIWPDECFSIYPDIYETDKNGDTPFEKAWKALSTRIPICHHWHRADRLSRIGQFGVLLLGITNAGGLDQPLPGINARTGEPEPRRRRDLRLGYVRPFSQEFVEIMELESDPRSPRYGQPRLYQLTFNDPKQTDLTSTSSRIVHWTRVIHLADNRGESEVLGQPALEPVLNYILDLRKVSGGGAEMYWRAAFPGYSVETVPDLLGEAVMDEDSIKAQFEEYTNGLKRYLAMDGVTVKSLMPQMADPTAHSANLLSLIAATVEAPMRVFMGSESGHLASTQDVGNMNKRVGRRQEVYLDPFVIRPTIDRFQAVGLLPATKSDAYFVAWKDLNTMSDKDRALVSLQKSQALQAYVAGGVEAVLPVAEYLHHILGFTPEEASAMVSVVKTRGKRLTLDPLKAKLDSKPAGGIKKPAKATANRPRGAVQRN